MDEQTMAVGESAGAVESAPVESLPAEQAAVPGPNPPKPDFDSFLEHFPDVKPEDIPPEVWKQVARGVSLTGAWAMYENGRLRARLEEHRQREEGRQRTTGSVGSASMESDELERLWAEDE